MKIVFLSLLALSTQSLACGDNLHSYKVTIQPPGRQSQYVTIRARDSIAARDLANAQYGEKLVRSIVVIYKDSSCAR